MGLSQSLARAALYLERVQKAVAERDKATALVHCAELAEIARRLYEDLSKWQRRLP